MSRTSFRHQIEDYDIELDLTGRDYGVNRAVCFVRRGRFVSDIESLTINGNLYTTYGQIEPHPVPAHILAEIVTWVRSRGMAVCQPA